LVIDPPTRKFRSLNKEISFSQKTLKIWLYYKRRKNLSGMNLDLILKAKQNDTQAILSLQEALAPIIRRLAREYRGSLDAIEVWSAARYSLTVALKKFKPALVKEDPLSFFRVYLTGYIRNAYRSKSKSIEIQSDCSDQEIDLPDESLNAEEMLIRNETQQNIKSILKSLPNNERCLLTVLRGDESVCSASTRLGIPQFTVRRRVTKLKAKLRELLSKNE
jgi:RNA polymerase sigma factor (sigma-70 family)